jgi:CSLREA domain-containing protein
MLALALATALVSPLLAAPPASAATSTFTVNTTDDRVDVAPGNGACATANGTCSLRAAIAEANAAAGGADITVPAGTYVLSLSTGADAGDLDITKSVTIVGAARQPGAGATTIDGNGTDRILDVAGGTVTLRGVELRNGHPATGDGGAARVAAGASLVLRDSAIHGNTAERGGGIASDGTLDVATSALYGNQSTQRGGGIYTTGSLTVVNTTLSGNSASGGGGVSSQGTTTITYATITANQAGGDSGGGVQKSGGTTTITASIVYGNVGKSGPDCIGSPDFVGVNVLGSRNGCKPGGATPQTNDPQLGQLTDNGGPTPTHALAATSPAVDRIAPCLAGVATDQRGQRRPGGTACDVGAFEYSPRSFSLDLSVPSTPIAAGAAAVPVAKIPTTSLSSSTTGGSTVGSTPLGAIDLSHSPLGAIPLGAIPLGAIPLGAIPLGAILLSDIPVTIDGGWSTLLAGTDFENVPLETLTLRDVLPAIAGVPLEELGLGSTPLGAIPLGAIAFGSLPLGAIPLGAIGTNETQNLQTWCTYLGSWCTTLGIVPTDTTSDDDVSIVSLALAGVPLGAIPLGAIPLGAIPLGAIPLGAIPLGAIPLGAIPLGAIPLGAIPLGAIPLIVDCTKVDCQSTTITFADVAAVPGAFTGTLADLYAIAGIGSTPLGAITLDDILPGLVLATDLPWQHLDLGATPLQGLETDGPAPGAFSTTFTVGGVTSDVDLRITLPSGFRYEAASGRIDGAALEPTITGTTLAFTVAGASVGTHTLAFSAWAGLELGTQTITAAGTATVGGATPLTDSDSTSVTVGEAFEKGDSSDDVQRLTDATLHLAHVASSGDEDWYDFTVPAGSGQRASILLSNLPADYDLVLFGPDVDPLRGTPASRLLPVDDGVLGLDTLGASLPTETLDDIPLTLPWDTTHAFTVHAVSANRGTHDEQIDTALLRPGRYVVQVSGYNGAWSPEPYALRIRHLSTLTPSGCPPLSFSGPAPSTTSTLPSAGAYVGADTLFLVNRDRLVRAYPAGAQSVLDQLATTAAQPSLGVHGVVVPVDGDPAVRAAYGTWDAHPCSVDAANDVVRQIGAVIDRAVTASAGTTGTPTIRRVVLVGNDDQIPLARVTDATLLSNERSYGPSLGLDNAVGAALTTGHVLTDNPYGTARSIAVGGRELFVPELDLGRLVENPADIVRTLSDFVAHAGVLDTSSALVTGYDFLTDGAQQVATGLANAGVTPTTLVNETWTRADLKSRLTGPGIASVNAHFDERRALPAAGNTSGDESDLYTTGDLPADLRQSLLFSMGCHSGLNVPDISIAAPDWAQVLAQKGASWVANSGFGYGDTDVVALSEQLMANFAAGLSSAGTVGEALTQAKQQYLLGLAAVSPYDEKVVQQVVFYGLPMWRLPSSPTATTMSSTTRSLASTSISSTSTVSLDLPLGPASGANTLHQVTTDRGRYYEVDGDTLVVQNRPIQPKVVRDITRTGAIAHGALITGLESIDRGAFDPVYARPTVDSSASETERQIGDAPFPAAIQSVRSLPGRQTLVLVPGQFRDPVAGTGIGTERLFTSIDAEVQYTDPSVDDFVAPTIERTTVAPGGAVTVTTDDTATRVVVLARPLADLGTSTWRRFDLVEGAAGSWTTNVTGITGGFELFVQAVDAAGNVAISSGKAANFATGLAPTPGDVTIAVSGQPHDGWYRDATVSLTSTASGTLYYSIDGGPFVEYTGQFALADGTHVVEARDSTGGRAAIVIGVDGTPPSVDVTTTPSVGTGGWTATTVTVTATATDALSGVASVTMTATGAGPATKTVAGHTATLTVAAEGVTTVASTATDNAGNQSAAVSTTVRIDRAAPVINCPAAPTTWFGGNQSFSCTASDAASGLANAADASFTLTTSVTAGTETASAATGSRAVCDNAGNCVTAQMTGIKIDRKAPAISVTTPAAGAVYDVGSAVTAAFTCTDGGSGTATCAGTVASGSRIATSTPGSKTFTVTATDNVGNTVTSTVAYAVGYRICVLYDPTKAGSVGSTYPIKLQLCDGAGNNLSASRIVLTAIDVDGVEQVSPNFSGSSNSGYDFRYDSKLKGYIYNLSTSTYGAGTHWMEFKVDGVAAAAYRAYFTLA